MSIFDCCLPEPGKCPGKPLIALPDRPYKPIFFEITFKLRSYPTSIDEGTTINTKSGMNSCNFNLYTPNKITAIQP